MLKLLPQVKKIEYLEDFLTVKAIAPFEGSVDYRLFNVIDKLPKDKKGAKLSIMVKGESGEGYRLSVRQNAITVEADSDAGAFYGLQTLRQIFTSDQVPCVDIEDAPDFAYRGFYHDVTRGRVPTLQSLKDLIDQLAYYKYNALQLYVEHAYPFIECEQVTNLLGGLTSDEIKELDDYCADNFIRFTPSLSSFGHMFEILEQDKYKHLRVLKDFVAGDNFWDERMSHHTIDPLNPESIELVKSLINQYSENFTDEYFNICCDETFDLKNYQFEGEKVEPSKLYVDFVNKIISHVKSIDKKVMMWADILLSHPETIDLLPKDTIFLNWDYRPQPEEENIIKFKELNRPQIVCPGTWSWNDLCENVNYAESNIKLMAEYGFKHGAIGMLTTNWGDFGNPCSIELASYGMALGGEKSWNANSPVDNEFYQRVNHIVYENENAMEYLQILNQMQNGADYNWRSLVHSYVHHKKGEQVKETVKKEKLLSTQKTCQDLVERIKKDKWEKGEYKSQMILVAKGICLLQEYGFAMSGEKLNKIIDGKKWFDEYKEFWLSKNKPSELFRFEQIYNYLIEKFG